MTSRQRQDRQKNYPKSGPQSSTSMDKERHDDETRHHPEIHHQPHPAHHPQVKPALPPRHDAHTQSPEQALNIDHGTHEDRPRPGKIAKKRKRTGV